MNTSANPTHTLGNARVEITKDRLVVTTGAIERAWLWTSAGLVTVSLCDKDSGKEYAVEPSHACDWGMPGALGDSSTGIWLGSECRVSDDDGFSTPHLELISTIRYEEEKLELQHVVWVFPDAPGLRVQLRAKALPGFDPTGKPAGESTYEDYGATFPVHSSRAEYLPLDFSIRNERLYWGYYNNPGNRHDQSQDMLKEQIVKGWPIFLREDIDWASGAAVNYDGAGVMLVKESPKAVNQLAHYTGAFHTNSAGMVSTGWGLTPEEIVTDRFRECWANWSIVYQGGADGIQQSLKRFDAARYPVFPERDMFILSNTWGPANPWGDQFTSEEFVMAEIPALAEIGVDVMQIDDGWQKSGIGPDASNFLPKYKNGWKDFKAACDAHNLRSGLWVAIRNAKLDDLKYCLDELEFISWKADFDRLSSRGDYEERTAAYREVMKHAWMKNQFTLCPEYDDPRYGWYFAKEYGSIYFQNIQEALPDHLTMVPFQVLRQHWLMTKYFPANKLQVLLQNPKRVGKYSDGRDHSHGYCFAMGLPFVPCFFQSGQYLDDQGKQELKQLIALYKTCREDIFTSTTYPIGDLPDNESWSGFQMVSTKNPNSGHLLLFRELHNGQPTQSIQLKFLAGKNLVIKNLRTGESRTVTADACGNVEFTITSPADYQLLQYIIN